MKAVVYTRYGPPDVLRLTDVQTPVPKDDEVLVQVHAVLLNASELGGVERGNSLYSRIGGPFRPRHHILGSDIAGRVEAAGRSATGFRPGEDVFADILSYMGGFAEYVCVPETALGADVPPHDLEEAAALPWSDGDRACQDQQSRAGEGPGPARAEICGDVSMARRWLGHVHRLRLGPARRRPGDRHRRRPGGSSSCRLTRCGPRHRLRTREHHRDPAAPYHLILNLAAPRPAFACKSSLNAWGTSSVLLRRTSDATFLQFLLATGL